MSDPADGVLESRVPILNPWAGAAVVALHSHMAAQACGERCTVYGSAQVRGD